MTNFSWGIPLIIWLLFVLIVIPIRLANKYKHKYLETKSALDKLENSYLGSFWFGGVEGFPNVQDIHLRFALLFLNTLERPIECRIDSNKTFIEVGGNRSVVLQRDNMGIIIPKQKPHKFLFTEIALPNKFPAYGVIHFELKYGEPSDLHFHQIKEFDLELTRLLPTPTGADIPMVWIEKYIKDEKIGQ